MVCRLVVHRAACVALGVVAVAATANWADETMDGVLGGLQLLGIIVFIVPTLALVVRRLHDFGTRGWVAILMFAPVVFVILWFVLALRRSQATANQWGPPTNRGTPVAQERDVELRLRKLKRLRDEGLIASARYEQRRNEIIEEL